MAPSFTLSDIAESGTLALPEPLTAAYTDPARYRPARGLTEAIESAIVLGMPLLITGEPGTGKSQAARWLALHRLGARLLRLDVKSTTAGRDLLYSFDDVARFRDASAGRTRPLIDYVTFSALGEAIVRGIGGSAPLIPIGAANAVPAEVFGQAGAFTSARLLPNDSTFNAAAPAEHCVVLIDELDKAPRDTPNDLLAEIEHLSFDMPELGIRIDATQKKRPIILITSNSERSLPEPFLRRCLFFEIPPPDQDEMAEIVSAALDGRQIVGKSALFIDAWAFYSHLRGNPQIRKKPGTVELLAWLDCLRSQADLGPDDRLPRGKHSVVGATLICLVKGPEDQTLAKTLLSSDEWHDRAAGA